MLKEHSTLVYTPPLTPGQKLAAAILIGSLVEMVGCYRPKTYVGDGKIVATNETLIWFAPCTLYTVFLGPVDLARNNAKVFRMKGLPHKDMEVMLRLTFPDRKSGIEAKPRSFVWVELFDDSGRRLVKQEAHLNELGWSCSGGRRGNEAYIPVGAFTPQTKRSYLFKIEVTEPDEGAANLDAEAIVMNNCSL